MRVFIVRAEHPENPTPREIVCRTSAVAEMHGHQLLDVIQRDLGLAAAPIPLSVEQRFKVLRDDYEASQELVDEEAASWAVWIDEAEMVDD